MKRLGIVIVQKTFPGDIETPISAFIKLKDSSTHSFLLESAISAEKIGRYSFVGLRPMEVVEVRSVGKEKGKNVGKVKIEGLRATEYITTEPWNAINNLLDIDIVRIYNDSELPPLYGGLVGFVSYDAIRYVERIPEKNPDPYDFPDFYFIHPKILIAFDNFTKQMKIISIQPVEDNIKEAEKEALKELEKTIESLKQPLPISPSHPKTFGIEWKSNFSKEEFENIVEKAKEYIYEGDIFQVVLSQRLTFLLEDVKTIDIYRSLRMLNPSPYMYLLSFGDIEILGSSPELLVKVDEEGVIETRPIAGTRPRGKNLEEDKKLEEELLNDEKERAEHIMLVDLARNDIGRVAEYGSVSVPEYMIIEKFSHVMHIVSSVKGKKRADVSPMQVFMSLFPAGTVTGAPKVRAMEIIEELENVKRGPYAGGIMYLSYNKTLDSCITIRTLIRKGKEGFVQAGAGIVYDSIPENEYMETLNKAKAILRAIEMTRSVGG